MVSICIWYSDAISLPLKIHNKWIDLQNIFNAINTLHTRGWHNFFSSYHQFYQFILLFSSFVFFRNFHNVIRLKINLFNIETNKKKYGVIAIALFSFHSLRMKMMRLRWKWEMENLLLLTRLNFVAKWCRVCRRGYYYSEYDISLSHWDIRTCFDIHAYNFSYES